MKNEQNRSVPEQELYELSARLLLDFEEQDWGIINANAERLKEFINVYNTWHLSKTQKFEMFELVLASMNEALEEGVEESDVAKKLLNFLKKHGREFPEQVNYWAELNDYREFPLSKVLKEFWGHKK